MQVGTSLPRVDGPAKLLGATRYVDDLKMEGMLYGATVRTRTARGRLKAIQFDPAFDWDDFIIVDHNDIPGPNEVQFIEHEQPALVADEFRHAYEPVALLAHADKERLRRALEHITLDVEPLPPVLDPCQSLDESLIQYGDDNVFKNITINKGDLDAGFAQAAHVIEGEYATGAQEHVYLENQGMLAYEDETGRLVIKGSMQCPYYVVKSIAHLFGLPDDKIRIVQTPTGGGFGGKEDYPSIIAIHTALLARKAGQPVKIIYERGEDMAATTKRHPSVVRHRTGVDAEGRLLAMEIEVILDGGAYLTLSPVVLSRGVIHAAGPYRCENIRIHGEARLTNKPPNGAFRGFGAPQTLFAIERHMDVIAAQLGLPPEEMRRRNLLNEGETTATSQVIKDKIELANWMDEALASMEFQQRRERYAEENKWHPYLRRGVGMATFMHGAGFTGGGEAYMQSEVWVEGRSDGKIEVLVANTDIGQGTSTVLAQIAADRAGVNFEDIVIAQPDTSRVPNSGPTVASRTVMVVGGLIERACDDLRQQVDICIGTKAGQALAQGILEWHRQREGERLLGRAKYTNPGSIVWDDETYTGDAYGTYAWATYLADVEVDLRTYEVRVRDFVADQEVGKVINPTLARGQIQGGVVQAIGWALTEEILEDEGAMRNNQMTNYIIPVCGDLPPIRVSFREVPGDFGPQGAKGIGELPMDGPAPAIANAIAQALGSQNFNTIPLTPERMMECCEEAQGGEGC